MDALSQSDAPYWGAVEWLLKGQNQSDWSDALNASLSKNCRIIIIYSWRHINSNYDALNAIKEINK